VASTATASVIQLDRRERNFDHSERKTLGKVTL
jgi:hypothetical protein